MTERDRGAELQAEILDAIADRRQPCAMHVFESKREMARAAEAEWPGDTIAAIARLARDAP